MLGRKSTESYICDCMLELMQEKPLESIKVAELTRYAQISRTTFYRYFETIYDVLQMVEDEFFDEMAAVVGENYAPDLRIEDAGAIESYVAPVLDYLRTKLPLIRQLNGPNGDPAFRMRLSNRIRGLCERAIAQAGSAEDALEQRYYSEFVVGGVVSTLDYLARHENEYTEEQMERVLLKVWRHLLELLR